MKLKQTGVLPSSDIYIHMPSAFARQALYYVEMAGDYQGDAAYCISRPYFDMYMLFWIRAGELSFQTPSSRYTAGANSIVMLDCKQPHEFCATGLADWIWMHVNGAGSAAYYDLLRQHNSLMLPEAETPKIAAQFEHVIEAISRDSVNEHQISACVHQILSELAMPEYLYEASCDALVRQAIAYMDTHYAEDISLEKLAAYVGLSPSYFSRLFKKETNSAPYDFLMNLRIKKAKRLLLTPRSSTEAIAAQCGFNSLSNFIRAFKKATHMTPTQFRKMRF